MIEKLIPFNQLAKAGYNRGINRAHVNKIKNNFHDDMVQPAIVSFRDGQYWIIDHQHQTQAIFELNNSDPSTPIRCDVRTGLTYEQEADLYYRLNTGSKPLNFEDKVIGLIAAKDETALEFRDTVEACGYIVGGDHNKSLRAVKAAWDIFSRRDGKEVLADILTLTNECWPNTRDSAKADIMSAFDLFLCCHGDEYSRDWFVKKLSQHAPTEISKRGDTYFKQMNDRAYTKQYCTYTQVFNCYNTGLRGRRLTIVSVNEIVPVK